MLGENVIFRDKLCVGDRIEPLGCCHWLVSWLNDGQIVEWVDK